MSDINSLKKKNNSLIIEIWKYFLIFSVLILAFLWTFQVIFFDSYYKATKIKDAKNVANDIKSSNANDLQSLINEKSLEKEVCIEISDNGAIPLYSSRYHGKGCLANANSMIYKSDFIISNKENDIYYIKNKYYDNDTVVYALKLNDSNYAFINTSIEPIESTASILTKQLIIITIVVLILSFIISFFISKHISKPIIDINDKAKQIGKRKTINFKTNTNITELNELSNTLKSAQDELNKTNDLRRDLMANISHDLKTPLTMIKAYAEMSIDIHKNNEDKQRKDMETIIEEADRLTLLVSDILTLSKMQSNVEILNIEEFDIIELITNILKRYEYLQETEKQET